MQRQSTQGEQHLAFWTKRLSEPSFVYAIESGAPVKIGSAKDVQGRMALLQCGNPVELRLLYVVPGDEALERLFHRKLRGSRVRGEWFDGAAVPAFLRYMAELADQMVKAYDGSEKAPHYADVDPRELRRGRGKRNHPMTVRFVEPNPKVPTEVAEEMRNAVAGCSPSLYLGPANSLMRKPISHLDWS